MVIQIYTSSSLPPNKLDEQLRKPIKNQMRKLISKP